MTQLKEKQRKWTKHDKSFFICSYRCVFILHGDKRTPKEDKEEKEILVFVFLMSLSIILLSLHFLDLKLPYVVEVADFITKPITEPLKNWLATFQQP